MLRISILFCLLSVALAAFWKGKVDTDEKFEFIERFGYAQTNPGEFGVLNYTITPTDKDKVTEAHHLKVALYHGGHWDKVYKTDLTCEQKLAIAKYKYNVTAFGRSHYIEVTDDFGANFWYVVVLNCQATKDWSIAYEIIATNPGGFWSKQFSSDEQGVAGLYTAYFLFYIILLGAHFFAVFQLKKERCYHVLVKLVTLCLVLEFLHIFFMFCHEMSYANNGVGAPGLAGFANFIDLYVQVVFMMVLLLLAQGWAISHNTIHNRKVLLIAFGALALSYLILFIWQYAGRDRASDLYVYESVPGALILTIRAGLLVWYLLTLRNTINQETEPTKRRFFVYFGGVYTAWFAGLLLVVIIGAMTPALKRELTVLVLYNILNFAGFGGMVLLLWPTWATQLFAISAPDLLFSGSSGASGAIGGAYDAI